MTDDSSGRETTGTPEDGSAELSTSRAFGLLSNQRRRHTLWLLKEHGHVSLPDVAEEVTVEETGTQITEISPEAVRDTYMMLYHSDIPKLVDADVVVYDQEQDVLATGENFSIVADVLEQHFAGP
jgi:hypothetical protein